ncbi:replication initiator protein WhiP [Metallosphaera tengchongensis]|uniref:Replication initiator protein WhiP n=1 Tax=Metallosphaera tengchongensis TaxID=1532350 RepID=A0A6N0NR55_9CREN|nr:replication initiator protein WhiP [Metallosphaera tengchongensis]QKQ99353.1 replication initiator protein WhiP [Metallosphaera tengchongensis]
MSDRDSSVNRATELSEEVSRSSPRSKLMDAILVLLHARPLRTSEISSNLGYETKYVSSYLSYWKKRGLVYQEGGRWYLTPDGENLAVTIIDSYSNSRFKEMLMIAKQMINEPVKESINNKKPQSNRSEPKEVLSFIDSKTKSDVNKQQRTDPSVCISDISEKLDNDEKDILLFLLERYKQWGSTYVYLDQLQEEYKADSTWLFKVLRGLQTKRVLYLYNDPKLGFRIGFSQSVKRKLENC